ADRGLRQPAAGRNVRGRRLPAVVWRRRRDVHPGRPEASARRLGIPTAAYLENDPLWKGANQNTFEGAQSQAMSAPLKIFRCPARGRERTYSIAGGQILNMHPLGAGYTPNPYTALTQTQVAQTDYAAVGGVDTLSYNGAFVPYGYNGNFNRPSLRTLAD